MKKKMSKVKKALRPTPYALRPNNGFTLMELLVSMGVLLIVLAIGSSALISLFKTVAKARVMALVKQEGNYALWVMSRMIRNSQRVIDCDLDFGNYITIENPDKGITTFRFYNLLGDTFVASDSAVSGSGAETRMTGDQMQLADGMFACSPSTNELEPYVVAVSFKLSRLGAGIRADEGAAVNFQTTVNVRNPQ